MPPGSKLAFFKLFVPKKEVYVGEMLAVEFQVYVREGLANAENILQSFEQYNGCPLKAEGVSIFKTAHAQRRRVRSGNAIYGVATLVTSLSPVKTGPITIGSMDVNLTLQIPLRNQPRRDPFDPFGMFQQMQVEERQVALSAEPETLTALPLPRENVPADFNGAVGNFSMTVSAGPTNCRRGRSGHGQSPNLGPRRARLARLARAKRLAGVQDLPADHQSGHHRRAGLAGHQDLRAGGRAAEPGHQSPAARLVQLL